MKMITSFARRQKFFTLSLMLILMMAGNFFCHCAYAAEEETVSSRIQRIFDGISAAGNALNSGGANQAKMAVVDTACRELVAGAFKESFLTNILGDPDVGAENIGQLQALALRKIKEGAGRAKDSLCVALSGEDVAGIDFKREADGILRQDVLPMAIETGRSFGQMHGIPFLSHVEVGVGAEGRGLISYISSVQPIWEDTLDRHHIFAQASYYRTNNNDDSLNGFRRNHDTINMGLAYRYLTPDKNYLYGANVFFDHAPKSRHNRMSIGIDARTSQLAFAANKYFPVSDWKRLDSYYEEKAAGGFDMTLRGQVPSLPSWTGSVQAYQWDNQGDNGADLFGTVTALEYSPIPAVTLKVGMRDESQSSPSVEAGLRFSYDFDKPDDLQWRERKALAPVSDYVYEKVERQNIIRTKQQRRAESKMTVLQTVGANTAIEVSGNSSLQVGQVLLMPVTVTVANTIGAVARLRLSDGSFLTVGQNTQVRIEPTLITLITGTIQYTSNGSIQTVIVPGGTITLHGTDIDVVSSGGNSSVRVRDGQVDFVGTTAGSATLDPEEAAESIAGVVGALAMGSPNYVAHTDTVSERIDRVADPVTGEKVTPYPYEEPRVVSDNMTVGGTIVFGLRFSAPIVVSGGTPRLTFTINGNTRNASYVSGSGTNDLQFSYTNVLADISATSLTVTTFDKNGASVMGNGKDAVTTIADATLSVSGTGDVTAPSGYGVTWVTSPIIPSNQTAAAFNITSAEIGATYAYTITSSGGAGTVTGSGTVAGATVNITGLDVSALPDGTLTSSVVLTDTSANAGAAATGTAAKDVVAPTIVLVGAPSSGTYEP